MRSPVPPDRITPDFTHRRWRIAGWRVIRLRATLWRFIVPRQIRTGFPWYLAKFVRQAAGKYQAQVIGPADEPVAKINDIYRKAIYIKHDEIKKLTAVKNLTEQYVEINTGFKDIRIQYEVN